MAGEFFLLLRLQRPLARCPFFLSRLICGAVGSLVVANRMAFFSDALAHCSFAGVAFGLLLGLILRASDEKLSRVDYCSSW